RAGRRRARSHKSHSNGYSSRHHIGAKPMSDQKTGGIPHILPALPYADNALDPVISANTLSFHHGKHHKTYVDNLNKLIAGTELADRSLEEIIAVTAGQPDKVGVFNNAAQIWNHTFYWSSLTPGGGGQPPAALGER